MLNLHYLDIQGHYIQHTAIIGPTIISGILVLDYIKDVLPVFSAVGITCGSILALHGIIELIIHHYKTIKRTLKNKSDNSPK